jgi:4-amino-4-deoxy-L-arabinose transferase-like glycosyltransferase
MMSRNVPLTIKQCLFLVVLACLAAPYVFEAGHPKYSYIGDEWGFFELGHNVIDSNFLKNPLSGGVFINNPMLTQMIQAFFMALLGGSVWSWKTASLLPVALSTVLVFIWTRMWFGELIALTAAFILASSSYLWSFSLVGYTHQFGVAHLLLLHVLISKLVRGGRLQSSVWGAPVTGLVAGLSFYEFGGLVFPLILTPYLLFITRFGLGTNVRRSFLIVLIVGALMAVPGLLDSTYRNNVFGLAAFPQHPLTLLDRLGNGMGYLVSFASMNKSSHFAYGPYVDAVSRVGVALGIVVCLLRIFMSRPLRTDSGKRIGSLLLLGSTLIAAFAYGTTSPYPEPPRTRGIFMVPHFAILAGIGLGTLAHYLAPKKRWVFFAMILTSILFLNLVRRHQFFTIMGVTPESCITWQTMRSLKTTPTFSQVYVRGVGAIPSPQGDVDLRCKVRQSNALLAHYVCPCMKTIGVEKEDTNHQTTPADLDLSEVNHKLCRDIAIAELPWYARGLSDKETWW